MSAMLGLRNRMTGETTTSAGAARIRSGVYDRVPQGRVQPAASCDRCRGRCRVQWHRGLRGCGIFQRENERLGIS